MQEQLSLTTPTAFTGPEAALHVFERILVPVDFSQESHAGLHMARELQRRFGSDVCAFNLTTVDTNDDFRRGLGDGYSTADLELDGRKRLHDLLETIEPGASREVLVQVYVGEDVARWVHDVATAWQATLVVLATHPSHTVFRSLTEKIMRAMRVPVLILR